MTRPLRSTLLVGKVRHRRPRPTVYALEHDVWYFGLDLDELDRVIATTGLLGRNRRALVELRDGDHLPVPAQDLARDFRAHLSAAGLQGDGWQIELVTNLRVAGYVFNPASFYLCRDPQAVLRAVVVEVHNTYGERHLYTLRPEMPTEDNDGSGGSFSSSMAKRFWVSPFIGLDGRYRVTVRERGKSLRIAINLRDAESPLLSTSVVLERRPLTRSNLVRLLLRHPFMTHKTIGLIHWHALRLWLRGVPFRTHVPKSSIPNHAVTEHVS